MTNFTFFGACVGVGVGVGVDVGLDVGVGAGWAQAESRSASIRVPTTNKSNPFFIFLHPFFDT
jgi:hypothetical protein